MNSPNGLLLVDKASGLTSHDVVARVRKLLGEKKVGHAGTLDPLATGLLVIAVGPSTRLLRFAQLGLKRYSGVVRFGEATNTLDADGEVVATATVPSLNADDLRVAAEAMCGPSTQIPPMVSALKVNGRRLYALAREGTEVERSPRPIDVSEFTLWATSNPLEWAFHVVCTPGTYVRVLLVDLAERVGTLGHLASLRRLSSGSHDVTEARTLEDLEAALTRHEEVLRAPRELVSALAATELTPAQCVDVRHGKQIDLPGVSSEFVAGLVDGALVAVLRQRAQRYQPDVVLASV